MFYIYKAYIHSLSISVEPSCSGYAAITFFFNTIRSEILFENDEKDKNIGQLIALAFAVAFSVTDAAKESVGRTVVCGQAVVCGESVVCGETVVCV